MEDFVDGLLDEDEGDEAGKVLLGEPRDVADEGAGIEGHKGDHDDAHPHAGPESEGQVLQGSLFRDFTASVSTHEFTSNSGKVPYPLQR